MAIFFLVTLLWMKKMTHTYHSLFIIISNSNIATELYTFLIMLSLLAWKKVGKLV